MRTEVVHGAEAESHVTLGTEQKQTATYTQDQLEKAIREAKTSVMADARRFQVEGEKALKAAQDARDRLAQLERDREEAELEAAKDEPDKLRAIRLTQELRQHKADLAKARDELAAKDAKLIDLTAREQEELRKVTVKEVAAKTGVSASLLAKLAKATDGTAEAIEDIAKDLPKEAHLRPDSNRSLGGTSQSKTQVMQDYTSGKINTVQYAEKMRALGEEP